MLLLALMDRVYKPGGLVRYVPVLEGPEALGKSKFLRWLVGSEWYMDFSISMETKDAHMATQGHWSLNWANSPPSRGRVSNG